MPRKKSDAQPGRKSRRAVRGHQLAGLEQVRAVSHPLRMRLLQLFAEKPRTTKQAAEELGESPTRLYHHVAALERAGLVRLRETRPNRGATEKYFEAVANTFTADAQAAAVGRKGARRDHAAMGFVVFDQAREELVHALASGKLEDAEALMALRVSMRLSPKAAKRLKRQLLDLVRSLRVNSQRAGEPKARRELARYALTIALVPTDTNLPQAPRKGYAPEIP
jgi:DNA-binding transcriptional ArsR family regulator